ncbi:MAG: hypothetical protein IT434_11080 [Phycisphaerales bacterium]|nr:hypothetical protein [Phycisphaerales bacterium]
MTNVPNFSDRSRKQPLLRPRRVRGGVKLLLSDQNASWAAQRWVRLVEQAGEGQHLVEGIDYAKNGQTKRLSVEVGRVDASVQGRAYRPYTTVLSLTAFSHDEWDRIVEAMSDQAIHAAKLLSGELPPNIEDLFAPLGLRLFPTEPTDVKVSCTCDDFKGGRHWCKHAVCVAMLFAERLSEDPFHMFTMRGMAAAELLERLRQRRSVARAGNSAVPVYAPRLPGEGEAPSLDQCLDKFWDAGPGLHSLDFVRQHSPVKHPLLRRLGPSPFQGVAGASFPLVGLLATCYEVISRDAVEGPPPALPGDAADDSEESGEQTPMD